LGAREPLTLTVWHSWSAAETAVLAQVAGEFQNLCPSVAISLTQVSNSTTLNERYRAATQTGGGPHVLIGSTQWMAQLAEDDLIRALDNELLPGELAAFVPAAVSALEYDNQLYAYPESVRSVALIYNPALVTTTPRTLHELSLQVDSEHALAMPLTFFYAYWGLAAFGGQIIDAGGGLHFDQAAASEWLVWLRTAARRPGFHFTSGRAEAENLFLERKVAFLISGPWSLPRLEEAMPAGEIAVALLPSGPANRAAPILEVEGVMLNANVAPDAAAAGLAFARYLGRASSAEALAATGVHIPANVTASLAAVPLLEVWGEQAQMGAGVVQDSRWLQVFAAGDELYRSVVLGDADVQAAVAAFAAAISRSAELVDAPAP
jgi:ABC-type glycerol-3-phosphate transport system substrate-binding protein